MDIYNLIREVRSDSGMSMKVDKAQQWLKFFGRTFKEFEFLPCVAQYSNNNYTAAPSIMGLAGVGILDNRDYFFGDYVLIDKVGSWSAAGNLTVRETLWSDKAGAYQNTPVFDLNKAANDTVFNTIVDRKEVLFSDVTLTNGGTFISDMYFKFVGIKFRLK